MTKIQSIKDKYLWQFLLRLLHQTEYISIITWTNRKAYEFKLVDPEYVASLWGKAKKRPTMNYTKLSRSLRYYYEKNIMLKVPSERYIYKFIDNHDLQTFQKTLSATLVKIIKNKQNNSQHQVVYNNHSYPSTEYGYKTLISTPLQKPTIKEETSTPIYNYSTFQYDYTAPVISTLVKEETSSPSYSNYSASQYDYTNSYTASSPYTYNGYDKTRSYHQEYNYQYSAQSQCQFNYEDNQSYETINQQTNSYVRQSLSPVMKSQTNSIYESSYGSECNELNAWSSPESYKFNYDEKELPTNNNSQFYY